MKPPAPPELPAHEMVRYVEAKEMTDDIVARQKAGWALHSWHPSVEMMDQIQGHDRVSFPINVFYALYYELPKPRGVPGPMAVR